MPQSEYLAIQEQRAAKAAEQEKQNPDNKDALFDKQASIAGKIGTKASVADYWTSHSGAFHRAVGIGMSGDTVELEDGSVWSVYSGHRYKTLDWLSSDTILITQNNAWFSSYKYRLVNQNTGASVEVDLTLAPIYNGPYTHWIVAIDYLGRYVWLEDGSRWHISSEDAYAMSKWLINDTVIIGINDAFWSKFTPNVLINVTYSATYIHGKCEN
jgi:hypothetical protein